MLGRSEDEEPELLEAQLEGTGLRALAKEGGFFSYAGRSLLSTQSASDRAHFPPVGQGRRDADFVAYLQQLAAGTAAVMLDFWRSRFGRQAEPELDWGIEISSYRTTLPMGKGLSSSAGGIWGSGFTVQCRTICLSGLNFAGLEGRGCVLSWRHEIIL